MEEILSRSCPEVGVSEKNLELALPCVCLLPSPCHWPDPACGHRVTLGTGCTGNPTLILPQIHVLKPLLHLTGLCAFTVKHHVCFEESGYLE